MGKTTAQRGGMHMKHKQQVRRLFVSDNALIPAADRYGRKPVSPTKNGMRNQPCPCGSRKKYKKCCGPRIAQMNKLMNKPYNYGYSKPKRKKRSDAGKKRSPNRRPHPNIRTNKMGVLCSSPHNLYGFYDRDWGSAVPWCSQEYPHSHIPRKSLFRSQYAEPQKRLQTYIPDFKSLYPSGGERTEGVYMGTLIDDRDFSPRIEVTQEILESWSYAIWHQQRRTYEQCGYYINCFRRIIIVRLFGKNYFLTPSCIYSIIVYIIGLTVQFAP